MAGTWIIMHTNLISNPKVKKIRRITDSSIIMTIGRLYAVWAMADEHSVDGVLNGTTEEIDDAADCEGFGEAMVAVGWLEVGDGSITLPDFGDHNGQTAKNRYKNAKRMKKTRSSVDDVQNETHKDAQARTEPHDDHTTKQNSTKQDFTPTKQNQREKESLSLGGFAVEQFRSSFPPGLMKTNWTDINFENLSELVNTMPLTTIWQVRKCITKLQAVEDRRFAVPNPDEVFREFRAIEKRNKMRERNFERETRLAGIKPNLASYNALTVTLGARSNLIALFGETLDRIQAEAGEGVWQIWDSTVPKSARDPYRDLLIDPLADQFSSLALRQWVIDTHRGRVTA